MRRFMFLSLTAMVLANLPNSFRRNCGAAEPVASDRPAASALLDYLGALSSGDNRSCLSGQNVGHANFDPIAAFDENVLKLRRRSMLWPAILAVDFGLDEIPADLQPATDLLALHWRHGGIVTASMHPRNPWRRSEAHDRRTGPLAHLFSEGTSAQKQWQTDLERVADGLEQLRDHGVIVLWRPLHEMNGDWFWWGKSDDRQGLQPEEFVELWKEMFDYFTYKRKLDNLIWVYSVAVQTGEEIAPVLDYYPGDAMVDIVGMDAYDDRFDNLDAFGSYTQLSRLNKPMGLTEVGPLEQRDGTFDNLVLLQRMRKDYPKLGFFVFWHSWTDADVALVDNARSEELIGHKFVIDRDELPIFQVDEASASGRKSE